MKIAEVNMVTYGSTGKIMLQIADVARIKGHEVKTFSPVLAGVHPKKKIQIKTHSYYGSWFENSVTYILSYITGYRDCFGWLATKQLLKELDKFKPDILHLHNLHSAHLNLKSLFEYIKKNNIHTVWTLHDCWAFTGQCPYFTMIKCGRWKEGCYHCEQYKKYPSTWVDRTDKMWRLKREWFTGVNDMTIVTPSQWLANLVKESYLKDYPVKVIHNGIDLSIFKPTPSAFRTKCNIPENKYILLGVAFGWGKRKGLDVFIELYNRLETSKYQIILVGTNENIENQLPKDIISIRKTHDQKELAEIYTAADLFVNPTREENYPTVNMEAIACGTPVITFETGGSPEIIDETCGTVISCDDIESLIAQIQMIRAEKIYNMSYCCEKAKTFDMYDRYREYLDLYTMSLDNIG